MNNQGRPPPLFPWPSYLSGPHSSLTSAPRFPYDISGAPPLHIYPHSSPAHGHTRYHGRHASSPPMGIRASPPSIVPVPGSRLEYSRSPDKYSRYSASSPRRRYPLDDDFTPENESVVVNAGFSFLMGKENSIIHKHVDIHPAHAISEAPSSGLTRQIDKFLKKSDHTLDRYQNLVQSRSGGMVGGLGQRGKSLTPAGVRDESPEPSTLGLSYRSQRSTSAASIAVKAEKHLESLKSGDKVRNTATAPIAEHEEDQLDDDLSNSDSSLDGFDTDDDVPRSTDVFDISDDTSADLSKLSAIEVDPTTNCSTPFDPSRLDDLSSDSEDEYFDVVQLPGLRPPKSSSTHTPSASPLPDQQHSRPSEGKITQEPSLIPPAHSQSMPAVNKGLTPIKMGNIQSYSPSAITGTDTKDPVNAAQQLTQRKCTDTANLANAINVLAPPSSTKAKAENTLSGDIELEAQHTNKTENTLRKECTALEEVTISGQNLIGTESHQSSHFPCKDKQVPPYTSHDENLLKTVNFSKEEIDETHKATNDDNIKETYVSKPLSHNESNIKSNLGVADTLIKHTIFELENSPKSQISSQETLELQERNQTNGVFDTTQKDEGKFKSRVSSKEESKLKEDSKVKPSKVNMQKAIVEAIPTLNSMQKENINDKHTRNEEEIASKAQIISGIAATPNDPSSSNTDKESGSERKYTEPKVEEAMIEETIVKNENVLEAKNLPDGQKIGSKKNLDVLAKVETLKTKIAEVEIMDKERNISTPNNEGDNLRKLAPSGLKSNKTEKETIDYAVSREDELDFSQKRVNIKDMSKLEEGFKPRYASSGTPPSSPPHTKQEPSVKPKYGKVTCTEPRPSVCVNTNINSNNEKITESSNGRVSKLNDFKKETTSMDVKSVTRKESKPPCAVDELQNAVNESIHVSASCNDKASVQKLSADTSVLNNAESSISKEQVVVSLIESSLAQNSCSLEFEDKKIASTGSPSSNENFGAIGGTIRDLSVHKDGATKLKGKSLDVSLNKNFANIPSSTTTYETNGKPIPKQATEPFLEAVAVEQNVCLDSPVSGNRTVTGTNITQIVTEKPHITPNSGLGPMPCKVSSCNMNEKAISKPEVVGNEATLAPNSVTKVGFQPTKTEGRFEKKNRDGSDALVSAKFVEKKSPKEKSDVPTSKKKGEENFAKIIPMNEHFTIGDEVVDAKIVDEILKDSKLEMLPENKVQSTVQSVLQVNGNRNNDNSEDKDDVENNFSEVETFVDRSRCSSVASDTSHTMSPDVSQRTGIKKPKGEKLSAMMNIWENEDVSQASEKSKMKHPPNKPKVGKISGIKDMFESGKVAEKPEILNNPNLSKLRLASGANLVEPNSTPSLHKTLLPGASGIASVNAAKFGGTSKFKKPSECPPSAGDRNLRREKSILSGNDLKRNDSNKKENTIANLNNQKDLGNVISKELENQGSVSNSCNSVVGSNNQKNLGCVVNSDDHNYHVTVTVSENIDKTPQKDKNMINKGDIDDKEKSVCGVKEENIQKEESFQKVDKDKHLQYSKSAEAKASTIKKTMCSKDVPSNTKQSGVGGNTDSEIPNTAEISLQFGEGMKKDLKKKKKRKKEKDTEIHDEKEKNQDDIIMANYQSMNDAVDGKTSIVNCAANISDGVKVELTKSKCTKSESNFDESKAMDATKEDLNPDVGNNDKGKDVIVDQGTSAMNEQNIDVNNLESRFKGNKTLGGLKSFIIESVAKGGKTLEDKLSKTGIPLGKKSAKTDYQKDSLTLDPKNKKRISSFQVKVSENENPVLPKSPNKMLVEDIAKSKLDYKQTVMNLVPALEPEVESLIKETSGLVEPKKTSCLPNYSFPKLTLATKPLHSVASFPDTPMGGEICITSLPASPTEEKKNFEFGDKHKILSLPASPTKEVHFSFEETSEEEEVFVDAIDPGQLDTLMPLPDVQNERDIRSRSRTPMDYREQSVTPSQIIAESEVILSETDRILRRSRSNKSLRRSYSRSLSNAALNRLSEVTADLSEEHTTAHLAGERLEAEQAERMKLEKEIDRLQTDVKRMTTANGKLEMEKLALRSEVLSAAELNGDGDDDDDEAADASLYKRKYEWCLREIELLKKQSKQQQEDDLDQLLLLKKQLEKKVADAYEETDEQRQVVAQLKRKCQRLQAEMNDLKILLEEQTSRNNLLEKKQRKFDQEVMSVQEELRHERANKDKIQRERDQILSEKYSFEQEVTTLKLELELKEEKVAALNRELDDLNSSGKVEEEVATLKKAKHDLELRIKDQEEELDDLAGQVQMLEGAKVRLEMSMEQMRKENRREISQREEELEEIRLSAQKKVKSLEAQLENEHEERTLLVREKHELERRITDLQDRTITHVDEDYVHKLKKELKKTKALLRDTQTMLEKAQSEGSHKLILRQLKTQLEDAEFAKTAALKARQCAESDLADVSSQLDEALRAKKDSEDKCARVNKEKAEIQTQLEEGEEELAEVMKKYKAVVSQLSVDQITLSEQSQQIAELEHSKQVLQERMLELSSKVEVLEGETANIHTQRRLEMKIKEIESKLELELTTRQRLESQIGRLKDQIERLSGECDAAKMKESQALDQSKKLARQLRDAKEDVSNIQQRYTEAVNKKSELEKQLELSDAEVITLKSDLKLAFKRIEDLQQAIQGDISDSDSELSDSDSDSDGSLSSYLTASLKHQRSSSNSTLRTPPSELQQLERLELPNSPCSEAMSAISEDLDDASNKESFA